MVGLAVPTGTYLPTIPFHRYKPISACTTPQLNYCINIAVYCTLNDMQANICIACSNRKIKPLREDCDSD